MTSIPDAFQLAVQYHQAGDLVRAAQLYREILVLDPGHPRATHFLGVVAFQTGQLEQAVQQMQAAIELDNTVPEFFNNLAVVYQQQGDFEQALPHYHQALRLDPRQAEAHKGLGDVYGRRGQHAQAIDSYRAALTCKPQFHDAYFNLGVVYQAVGNLVEAERCIRMAITLQPGRSDTLACLGDVLFLAGRRNEVIEAYRAAAQAAPRWTAIYLKLGQALQREGRLDEALQCYQTALLNQVQDVTIHVSLGDVYQLQGRHEEAKAAYITARELDPQCRFAWAGLGMMRQIDGDFTDALVCYRRALELDSEFGQAHFNLASLLLVQGDFNRGWAEYAWRWKIPQAMEQRDDAGPLWDGTPLPQGTLLVFGEQGFGDTLQFIRYLPLVRERAGRVVVECPSSLASLISRMPGIDQLVVCGAPRPHCDAQVPLLSLPGIFRTVLETIPGQVPYLMADPTRVARWKEELKDVPGFRVGVVWRGNPRHRLDVLRSFAAEQLAPLAEVAGVRLISLQKGAGSEQLAGLAEKYPVVGLGDRLRDFEDTAAVMQNLDLVVTCDSAPAHLAGAMGLPVWMPLQFSPDWRWLLGREDSPWYPTMRLFRQEVSGVWEPVFQRIAAELARLVRPGA